MARRWITLRREPTWEQAELPFLRRTRRLERLFRRFIIATTALVLLGMLFGTPIGRHAVALTRYRVGTGLARGLGLYVGRAEYEALRDHNRRRGIALVRGFLDDAVRASGPTMREFLRVAGLDARTAVLRWGNVNWTLALSSHVFEPDDTGRSYRLKPRTRSVWLIDLSFEKVLAMFEIPDTPEARVLGQAAGGRIVPESVQTTNSWGCRGPEPDLDAALRVLVLGDSNMQGLLVGDDQTPPARLEAELRCRLGVPVSVLNTGHLGYSLEQYYYTLLAYHDRFRPHIVVISICSNDIGDLKAQADWDEAEYWMGAIAQFCRARKMPFLAVPVPREEALVECRDEAVFPGKVARIIRGSRLNYLNPIEEFTTEHLRLRLKARSEGRDILSSPLFNGKYNDHHLSPEGCDLWARIVARRIDLFRQWRDSFHMNETPQTRPASSIRTAASVLGR